MFRLPVSRVGNAQRVLTQNTMRSLARPSSSLSSSVFSRSVRAFTSTAPRSAPTVSSTSISSTSTSAPTPTTASFSSAPAHAHDGTAQLRRVFAAAKKEDRPVYVAYVTAGLPSEEESVETIKALEAGGADVIELGVPFTDPLADGSTIQKANQVALNAGVDSLQQVLSIAKRARAAGVKAPLVLMGYYNPFMMYESENGLFQDVHDAGCNGFIVVDLPPEESHVFRDKCRDASLSFIPLIAPTTTDARIKHLAKCADSFVYAVSVTGTTGARATMSDDLPGFLRRIREATEAPVAIGFGIGDAAQFQEVGKLGDGVVIGSAIVNKVLEMKPDDPNRFTNLAEYIASLSGRSTPSVSTSGAADAIEDSELPTLPEEGQKMSFSDGMFGDFGGRFVPETLVHALDELEAEYAKAQADPSFEEEVRSYDEYIGRPSRLHKADRMTEIAGGATIWLKREDLNHTGAHKINNAVAQALLARRLGKTRLIAETGAGQHGVATATICAKMDIPLTVYMGAEDVRRQALNVFRMELMGAKVVAVDSGSRTLKDAINEAMRDWVTNIHDTHYLVGSAIGPHPFPTIVRDFQAIIGKEAKQQMLERAGCLPDACVACVGGGSNAIGLFHEFVNDESVRLIGVEAAGSGVDTNSHSATISAGTPGVLHGTKTYLLQNTKTGQIQGTHSISAGLDYPGVGPEHAWLAFSKRGEYVNVTDKNALKGFKWMSEMEGIIPALETSHAIYHTMELAASMRKDQHIVLSVSGRGDKDINTVLEQMPNFDLTT